MPHPIHSLGFWKGYFVTMRPYLLYISGIAGLAGMSLVPEPNLAYVALGMFPLFFAYGMGQALTDVFQTDTDSISAPYRPLVRGEIGKKSVFAVSIIGLTIGVLIMGLINRWLLIPGLLCIVGLATYTPFKRTWWGGPPWNSWIVTLLPLMGALIDPSATPVSVMHGPLPWLMAAIFFAYMNFVVGGYFKDVSADRATGYNTFQVRFGWAAGGIYSDLMALLAAACTFITIWPMVSKGGTGAMIACVVLLVTVIANAIAQVRLHLTRVESETHGPIATIVRSFILYASVVVLAYRLEWWPAVVVYYGLFEFTLWARPEKSQV